MLRVGRRASSCWRVLLAGARQTKPTAPSPWPVVTSGFAARSLLNRLPRYDGPAVYKEMNLKAITKSLDHRILATATLFNVGSIWLATRQLPLNPKLRLLLNSALGMTAAQVTLGVSTLLAYVPVSLGAAHQAGALTLFSIFITLLHALKQPKSLSRIAPALLRPMKQQSRGVVGLGVAKESA